MKRVLTGFVFVALCVGFVLPAGAHSDQELDDWLVAYGERNTVALGLQFMSLEALDREELWAFLLFDMQERHPCRRVMGTWTEEDCVTVRAARVPAPTRSSVVPSASSGMGSGVEQWRSMVAAYFPGDQVERALCIMSHESGGNPNAKNSRSTAAGLFQFLRSTWDGMVPAEVSGGSYDSGQVYVAEANVRSAAWLLGAAGWSQWSPYNRGLCR